MTMILNTFLSWSWVQPLSASSSWKTDLKAEDIVGNLSGACHPRRIDSDAEACEDGRGYMYYLLPHSPPTIIHSAACSFDAVVGVCMQSAAAAARWSHRAAPPSRGRGLTGAASPMASLTCGIASPSLACGTNASPPWAPISAQLSLAAVPHLRLSSQN